MTRLFGEANFMMKNLVIMRVASVHFSDFPKLNV